MRKNLLKKSLFVTILITTIFATISPIFDVKAVEQTPDTDGTYSVDKTTTQSAGDDYLNNKSAILDKTTGKVTFSENGLIPGIINGLVEVFMPKALLVKDTEGNPVTTTQGQYLYISKPGAIDSVVSMNQQMYENPSASGIVYAQNELQKIKDGHTAKAADPEDSWVYYPGLGFNLLKPIQDYWVVARNIAYIAMIVIIIFVAFLVVFRSNFSGQTQVTIANSIPNIVIALIMITISYPLSGLAIDLITVGSNLAQQILVQNTYSPGYDDVWNKDSIDIYDLSVDDNGNLITDVDKIVDRGRLSYPLENPKLNLQPDDERMSVWESFGTARVQLYDVNDANGAGLVSIIPTGGLINSILHNMVESAGGLAAILLSLVFAIAAFMASLKLFFKLLGKYVILLIYPVVSPFIMLTIAVPGQGAKAIGKYFKTLLSASLTFISVYAVFLFMVVLAHDTSIDANLKFLPPLLGYESNTGAMEIGAYIKMILAFALFISTPAIPDSIDQVLETIPANFQNMTASQRFNRQIIGGAAAGGQGLMKVGGFVGGRLPVVGDVKRPKK